MPSWPNRSSASVAGCRSSVWSHFARVSTVTLFGGIDRRCALGPMPILRVRYRKSRVFRRPLLTRELLSISEHHQFIKLDAPRIFWTPFARKHRRLPFPFGERVGLRIGEFQQFPVFFKDNPVV